MKNILILLFSFIILSACTTLKEINQTVNCDYNLIGAEVTEYSLNNLSADIALAITNKSKTTNARMKRFVGTAYMNNNPLTEVTLGEFLIPPNSTEVKKVTLNVPFSQVGKNIVGLVLVNSQVIDYKVVGTIYFDTPLGELPIPVTFIKPKK